MRVPLLDLKRQYLYIRPEIDYEIAKIVMEGRYIMGPEVKQFEEEFKTYIGTTYGLGVASGTDALVIILRSIAYTLTGNEYFKKEDLIITPSFTFTATGDAILRAGATPLFIDIDARNFNLNLEAVEEILKQDKTFKKIKGIVVVHLFGNPVNMNKVLELAETYGIFVVEDCAQATGSEWEGKKVGSFGIASAFSFFPTKNLGGFGDGGFITTNSTAIYNIAKILKNHGGEDKYSATLIGYNSRLDTIQAGILKVKLRYLDQFLERRKKIAQYYDHNLKDIPFIITPLPPSPPSIHTYNQYTIRITNNNRDRVKDRLKEVGIESMVYYPIPLHKMKVFKNRSIIPTPLTTTEMICNEVLSLPIEPLLTEEELEYVVSSIKSILVY